MEHDPRTDSRLAPQARELAAIAYRYHPRWHRKRESLDDYIERIPFATETLLREDLAAEKLARNRAWHGLLAEVKAVFPDYWVADARAPGVEIPSYQLIVGYEHPPGSGRGRHLVFRLSFLAPVYDFYESDQDSDTRNIERWLIPTPESRRIADKVFEIIPQHFAYTRLDPEVGATPMPDLVVGTLAPGQATLASTLFQASRTW